MKVIERNLQEIGSSLLVTVPKDWARSLRLKKGSKVKIMTSEKGILTIAPEFVIPHKKTEAVFTYDEHFSRRFIKEYFQGHEKILILTKGGLTDSQSMELHHFLKRFMNVQIIDESDSKVVVKSFKIEELSIEESLRRMYFLTLNLFDEISSKPGNSSISKPDEKTISEIRDTITRFYYMLVMQVRRFLEEGKFTQENQIPLIRAMDFRMVAEKVRRIGTILWILGQKKRNQDAGSKGAGSKGAGSKGAMSQGAVFQGAGSLAEQLAILKVPYTLAFETFLTNDFEKSLNIWKNNRANEKRIEGLLSQMKGQRMAEQALHLEQLLINIKEISRLTR